MKSENNLEELDMSFKDWNEIYFKELCSYKTGRLNSNAAVENGTYPFFTCSPQVLKTNTFSFDQDAILLAGNNANGIFHLKYYNGKFDAYQRTYVISSKDTSKVDNVYLYYYLALKLNYLKDISVGSATKFLTKGILDNILIKYPDYKTMKFIGSILRNIDEKIELNNQMNETLEEMAQAVFKRWFVDFEFPNEEGKPYKSSGGEMVESELGMIPKGWSVKSLDQIASFLNGLAMQKFRPNEDEDSLPVLKIKELRQEKVTSDSDRCTVNIDSKYKVNDGDFIFSWSGTLDARIWCGGEVGLNQHLFKVTSDLYPKWFYYMWVVEYLHQFIRIAADRATTMGHIKRQHLTEAQVLVPSREQLDKMGKVLAPIIEKIIQNKVEKRSLESLRDTVLPKLMSGEIRVSDLKS